MRLAHAVVYWAFALLSSQALRLWVHHAQLLLLLCGAHHHLMHTGTWPGTKNW
jgi:hypothetical protein